MSVRYQLYNEGASITIVRDYKRRLIAKSSITKISIIRDEIVRISTGSCLGGININYHDVNFPEIYSALDLLNQLSYWIYVIEPPAGPSE